MKSLWHPRGLLKNLNTQQSLEDRNKQIYRPAGIHEPHGPMDFRTLKLWSVQTTVWDTRRVLWITDFYLKFPSLKIAAEKMSIFLKRKPQTTSILKNNLKTCQEIQSCVSPPLDMSTLGDRNPETSDKIISQKQQQIFWKIIQPMDFYSYFLRLL